MFNTKPFLILNAFCVLSCLISQHAFSQDFFDNLTPTVTTVENLTVNRAVFDSDRGLIYATIPSGVPNADSLAVINPESLEVDFITGAGSNPNVIDISDDNSLVYLGVDGEDSFRTFDPVTLLFGDLISTDTRPAVVDDFAIQPNNPNLVVLSVDATGSSARGELRVFEDGVFLSEPFFTASADRLEFVDPSTLVGNDFNGNRTRLLSFDGTNLVEEFNTVNFSDGEIETAGGNAILSSGRILNPDNLLPIGTFGGSNEIEAVLSEGLIYSGLRLTDFVNGAGRPGLLDVYSSDFFTLLGTFDTGLDGGSTEDLFVAGDDILAVVSTNGSLSLISGVPTGFQSVPEPSSIFFVMFAGAAASLRRSRFQSHHRN